MLGFGQQIEEMWVRLTLKNDLTAGLTQATKGLTTWRDETNKNTLELGKWAAALGATVAPYVAIGAAVYGAIEKYGAMAQQLKDLSYQTGLSTTKLQQLQYAATLSGANFDRVSMAVGSMNLKIAESADKTSTAAKAFTGLGINPSGKSPDEIFEEIASALIKIEDPTKRAVLANELLGRGWREMLPFMQDYIDKKKEIAAHETISYEDLQTLADYKSTVDGITSSLNMMIAKLVVAAEKTHSLAAGGTEISKGWSVTEQKGGIGGVEKATNIMASKFGALSPPTTLNENIIDPFRGLTAKQAELKYLTDVTIPDLERKLKGAQDLGNPSDIGKAALDLLKAKEQATAGLTDATQEYVKSLEDVRDEQTRANTLKRNYLEDVQFAGGDISKIRSLRMSYNRDSRTEKEQINAAMGKAQGAGSAMIGAGGKAGDIIINQTITASKDYPIGQIIKDTELLSKNKLMQSGVRI